MNLRHLLRCAGLALAAAGASLVLAAQASAEPYIQLLGTKGGPSLLQVKALPQSMAIVDGDHIAIVDAGYGASYRLVESGLKLRDVREIYITHLHSDHVADYPPMLMNAWSSGWKKPIAVYGPPGMQAMTDNVWKTFQVDIDLRIADEGRPDPRKMLATHEVDTGAIATTGPIKARALRVHHSPFPAGQALMYRFEVGGHSIVFTGDLNEFPPEFAEFARGADILFSEVAEPDAIGRLAERIGNGGDRLAQAILSHHVTPAEVGTAAKQAGIRKVVLIHRIPVDDPDVTDQTWIDGARQTYDGPIVVGHDLMRIDFGQ